MGTYQQEFARLNEAQKQAVLSIDGPLMVIAGPGTGKTQLLSMRVAQILQKTDANPANILCLTFTEAAARNMRERLLQLIGESANHVSIHTFHGFGSDVIQRYPEYFAEQPLLKPVEDLGAYELLSDIFSSLPHKNPLSLQVGDEFVHLRSAQNTISWLKQAGLNPPDVRRIIQANNGFIKQATAHLQGVFDERPSPKLLNNYQQLLNSLSKLAVRADPQSLSAICVAELATAIDTVDPKGRYATTMTAWRNRWLVQTRLKEWRFVDQRKTFFLEALLEVYQKYQAALAERGWYTYDDMILRAITAVENEDELRLTLQEQYQYVMVDEYQDTNGAQNKLLTLLADNPVNEGRPNIMVVGDDDQAIYRFQGAELSVMMDFLHRWDGVKRIVLDKNYRSGTALLELSRTVILQGVERLENQVEDISKELSSGHRQPPTATIHRPHTPTELEQYAYIADEISRRLQAGQKPEEIAILAPKHRYLENLVPYLLDRNIPVRYERREHILQQPKIVELLNLAKLVVAAAEGRWDTVEQLLPIVLAAEYWQLEPDVLWHISIEAHKAKRLWLEIMRDHTNATVRHFAQAIPALAKLSLTMPLDTVLDIIVGNQPVEVAKELPWHIPYRSFYFSPKRLEEAAQDYFVLLGQIATLRERLREYRPKQALTLANLLEFVDVYRRSELHLLDTNPHATSPHAVELMTAYKAKGLEWDTVFVVSAHNDVWGSTVRNGNFSFGLPHNVEWVKPARDSNDDRLRLFYVALTRAKKDLYLTSYTQTQNGKPSQSLSWLPATLPIVELPPATATDLIQQHQIHWGLTTRQQTNLKSNLQPVLESYQLSATHLNGFLDLSRGGPQQFFYRHLLHFPEALPPSSIYGTAVHEVLHYMHCQLSRHQKLPTLNQAQKMLTDSLQTSGLSSSDKQRLVERGRLALASYYPRAQEQMRGTDKSECNFKNEGVVLDSAKLTGKIDVLRQLQANQLAIIDYKTGTPLNNWQAKGPYPQIRAHLYKQQLIFYQLLVEGSAHFKEHTVKELALQFVEPDEEGSIIYISYQPTSDEIDRVKNLIAAVWQRIHNLDFPDTTKYSLDLKGVKAFEDDLLQGKI